jgi:sodium/potassium-transporting ATPase subunit alpha
MAEPERPSHLRAYLEYLHNLFSYVLILCGIISLAIYPVFPDDFVHLYVGIVLIAIAFINGFLEYYQKYKSEELLKGFMVPNGSCARAWR